MPCTAKKTLSEIVSQGNHYCIGLKGNQPNLLQQAQQVAQTQVPLSQLQQSETGHGRQVRRRIQVFAAPPQLRQQWAGLATFVAVERSGLRAGESFERQSWFITSQVMTAQQAAQLIQSHRGAIENQLHWVKDVVQGEDDSAIQAANAATVMAFLRTWAISLFRRAGHASITKAIRLFRHDLPVLLSFI